MGRLGNHINKNTFVDSGHFISRTTELPGWIHNRFSLLNHILKVRKLIYTWLSSIINVSKDIASTLTAIIFLHYMVPAKMGLEIGSG